MRHLCRGILLLVLIGGPLGGCAFFGGAGERESGVRPMIAVDGTRIDVDDPIENGRALLLTGQYGLAVAELSRIVGDEPRNVRALSLLAEAYGRLQRFDLADRYHAEALAIDPNSVVALNNWGYSYLVRGETARAVGLLERAVAIKGDQPVVMANLRLAIGNTGASAAVQEPVAPIVAEVDVQVSDHVRMVRRTGRLVRLAPGVQLLMTEEQTPVDPTMSAAQPANVLRVPVAAVAPPPSNVAAQSDVDVIDSRTRMFRALFALMEAPDFQALPDPDIFAAQPGVSIGFAAP